ncbi:MAG: hypothetical protein OXU23_03335 [Candidatus Poribacteria bacterium]|nr:hypothetical protein [Candidatus Poribacteria bacterium]
MHWFQSSGITILKSQVRFNFGIGHGVILGGLISRIDMTLQGYRAILLETIPPQWKEELRMPLIQRGLAHAYGRREDKFEVGIQELDASDLVVNVYSKSELDDAEQLAQQLAEKVANEYAKYM